MSDIHTCCAGLQTICSVKQVLTKVIWKECVASRYPYVGECTLPLRVLGVQCATLRNRYGKYRFCPSLIKF